MCSTRPLGGSSSPGREGRRLRTAMRTTARVLAVAALAVAVSGCVGQGSSEVEGAVVAMSLPWPAEGQSSVEVEGLGSLGRQGEREPVPIASVTKVMTAYVILKNHPLRGTQSGPVIKVDEAAAEESLSLEESSAPVREGLELTERQLLELMLIPSGNNIARLLARWDAGSQEAFVAKMNRAAVSLGMTHTTYTGASGIEPTTTSTAVDQLKLARQVMKDQVFRSIVAKPSITVPGVPGTIINTNTLLGTSGVIGLKTGSSTPAGGALMWAAETEAGGRTRLILGVVLHQRANTTPAEGLQAALDNSRKLVVAIQQALPQSLSAEHNTE
ncbi:D-alanyl-D-alanine carboxypeptidase family protein [Planotetraspora mira]|uniref:D-alanyl-D-alanine carboxypeptidase n=1 Tax=Planotetraspora mira TaxID=58121 RepID=A0A8J3TKV0_9ACTN|nr:D-alanyl-D-alanine carboxypeptidase [Planotetraspora mira]GII26997.1 D-alanyl-D-alanine carboxypeptidase [Planotetraspora mira]